MTENCLYFEEYLKRCGVYRYAYISLALAREEKQKCTELNYQLLNTALIREEEFHPADLLLGWIHNPEGDKRQ